MKLAISASGPDLDSQVDGRFGRCAYFLIVDSETLACEALRNSAAQQAGGAGVAAAQLVAGAGAQCVLAAQLGPHALAALAAGGLTLLEAPAGTVRAAVEAYRAGRLQPISQASAPGRGMGMGGRR